MIEVIQGMDFATASILAYDHSEIDRGVLWHVGMESKRPPEPPGGLEVLGLAGRENRDRRLPPWVAISNGIGILMISGVIRPTSVWWSFSPGLEQLEASLIDLKERSDVEKVVLYGRTGGGAISRLEDFRATVKATKEVKPVHGYAQDITASAGYWALAECVDITADRLARVGSLGVFTVRMDTSELEKGLGVKTIVVRHGEFKGLEVEAKVDEKHLKDTERELGEAAEIFMAAVAEGRGWSSQQTKALFDGRTFHAETAAKMGMVKDVKPFREFLADLGQKDKSTVAVSSDDESREEKPMAKKKTSAAEILASLKEYFGGETAEAGAPSSTAPGPPQAAGSPTPPDVNPAIKDGLVAAARDRFINLATERLASGENGRRLTPAQVKEGVGVALARDLAREQIEAGKSDPILTAALEAGAEISEIFQGAASFETVLKAVKSEPFVADQHPNMAGGGDLDELGVPRAGESADVDFLAGVSFTEPPDNGFLPSVTAPVAIEGYTPHEQHSIQVLSREFFGDEYTDDDHQAYIREAHELHDEGRL